MYLDRAEEILQNHGWPGIRSPALLIEMWEQFVEACEKSYAWGLEEFDEDVAVRGAIEALLTDELLQNVPEFSEVVVVMKYLDKRLRAVIQDDIVRPDKANWWERLVLRYASEAYALGIRQAHGFQVDIRSA
jgi:hypothetical protein